MVHDILNSYLPAAASAVLSFFFDSLYYHPDFPSSNYLRHRDRFPDLFIGIAKLASLFQMRFIARFTTGAEGNRNRDQLFKLYR